jgi:hypothetical protein
MQLSAIHKEATEMTQKRIFEFGGYIAAAILIAFGVASIVMGVNGRNEVRTDIKREYIVGSPDMNKTAILAEAKDAKLSPAILATLPTCDVANERSPPAPRRSASRATCGSTRSRRRRQDVRADGPLPDEGRQGDERLEARRDRPEDR